MFISLFSKLRERLDIARLVLKRQVNVTIQQKLGHKSIVLNDKFRPRIAPGNAVFISNALVSFSESTKKGRQAD